MARRNYSNFALETTITAGISPGDTDLAVASSLGYPAAPFVIVVEPDTANEEFILVGAKLGLTFSDLTRGWDGSIASAHIAASVVKHVATALDFTEVWTHRHLASEGHTPLATSLLARARAYRSDMGFTSVHESPISWNAESYDSYGFHNLAVNPSRFTVPADLDGTYEIRAELSHGQFSGSTIVLYFMKNTVELISESPFAIMDTIHIARHQDTVHLVEGDYVETFFRMIPPPGSAVAIAFQNSYMMVVRIGD